MHHGLGTMRESSLKSPARFQVRFSRVSQKGSDELNGQHQNEKRHMSRHRIRPRLAGPLPTASRRPRQPPEPVKASHEAHMDSLVFGALGVRSTSCPPTLDAPPMQAPRFWGLQSLGCRMPSPRQLLPALNRRPDAHVPSIFTPCHIFSHFIHGAPTNQGPRVPQDATIKCGTAPGCLCLRC